MVDLFIPSDRIDSYLEQDPSPSPILWLTPENKLSLTPTQRPFLFVGSRATASSLATLTGHQITHILICAKFFKANFDGRFEYEQLALVDKETQSLTEFVPRAVEFIDRCLEKNGRVLLHCSVGKSRSCAMAIAYLVSKF